MTNTHRDLLRRLALSLMTNDNDISEDSYGYLRELLDEAGHTDIIHAVDATDDRFYLPECFDTPNIPVCVTTDSGQGECRAIAGEEVTP